MIFDTSTEGVTDEGVVWFNKTIVDGPDYGTLVIHRSMTVYVTDKVNKRLILTHGNGDVEIETLVKLVGWSIDSASFVDASKVLH